MPRLFGGKSNYTLPIHPVFAHPHANATPQTTYSHQPVPTNFSELIGLHFPHLFYIMFCFGGIDCHSAKSFVSNVVEPFPFISTNDRKSTGMRCLSNSPISVTARECDNESQTFGA